MAIADPPRPSRRRVRDQQRIAHLVAGVVLLFYVYLAPALGDGLTEAVRWVIVPVVAGSGLALRKWPRIRKLLRRGRR
jgi:hypothetical protein